MLIKAIRVATLIQILLPSTGVIRVVTLMRRGATKVFPHAQEPKMLRMSSLRLVFAMVLEADQNKIFWFASWARKEEER